MEIAGKMNDLLATGATMYNDKSYGKLDLRNVEYFTVEPVAKCIKGGSGLPALSLAPWCACRASQPELYHGKALKQNFFHFLPKTT